MGSDPVQAFPDYGQMKPEQLEMERLRREVTKLKAPAPRQGASEEPVVQAQLDILGAMQVGGQP